RRDNQHQNRGLLVGGQLLVEPTGGHRSCRGHLPDGLCEICSLRCGPPVVEVPHSSETNHTAVSSQHSNHSRLPAAGSTSEARIECSSLLHRKSPSLHSQYL